MLRSITMFSDVNQNSKIGMLVSIDYKRLKHSVLYLFLVYFSYLMVLITLQYIPINYEAAFLNIKQEQVIYLHYRIAFFSHVYSSIFVLLAGFTQFSEHIRKRWRLFHRTVGYLYLLLIIIVAAPSGFIMGIHANGGIGSKISFCILSVLWFVFTLKAVLLARKQDFKAHRAFMLRSYALTLSAISLRACKWLITNLFETAPMDTYKIVAWLGWVFNLLVIELYLRIDRKG